MGQLLHEQANLVCIHVNVDFGISGVIVVSYCGYCNRLDIVCTYP